MMKVIECKLRFQPDGESWGLYSTFKAKQEHEQIKGDFSAQLYSVSE